MIPGRNRAATGPARSFCTQILVSLPLSPASTKHSKCTEHFIYKSPNSPIQTPIHSVQSHFLSLSTLASATRKKFRDRESDDSLSSSSRERETLASPSSSFAGRLPFDSRYFSLSRLSDSCAASGSIAFLPVFCFFFFGRFRVFVFADTVLCGLNMGSGFVFFQSDICISYGLCGILEFFGV